MEKAILDILTDMKAAAANGDYEMAHGYADNSLCELVSVLAQRLGDEERAFVTEILENYERVGKWYA